MSKVALLVAALLGSSLVTIAMAARAAEVSATADPGATIADLAASLIPSLPTGDREAYLDDLFRLQLAAGHYAQAQQSLLDLRSLRVTRRGGVQSRATNVQYEILARARLRQALEGERFEAAFQAEFRRTFADLDDRTSALVIRALMADQYPVGISLHVPIEANLREAEARYRRQPSPSTADKVAFVRAHVVAEAYRTMRPLTPTLIAEDDARRYITETDVLVTTPTGAHVCALIVRPKAVARAPALLEFTIYEDRAVLISEARRSASNGYLGVEGLSRGKGCSPDPIVSWEHDGEDAAALIDWIARQPWSDGRVGMFGASYNGFTQWAALKHRPRALKVIMPAVASAPGVDSPMENGVPQPFPYPWAFYTTSGKGLDVATYGDQARWDRMRRAWYVSGRAYRDLDKIDGTPNPVWRRWMSHPTRDRFWDGMIPVGREFANIDIPVLATTGYYDGGQVGVLHYFQTHRRYRPDAQHYLLTGPYDHGTGNRGTINVLGEALPTVEGYALDPAALIDLGELRYAWFDHVLKGAPRPAILAGAINYEVMGANRWRHAPSLDAMGPERLRLHLIGGAPGAVNRLTATRPSTEGFVDLTVDLADRGDAERLAPGGGVLDTVIDENNGLRFETDVFTRPTEISGLFSAHLVFVTNKRDFDYRIELYELRADNTFVRLAHEMGRASIVGSSSARRRLLRRGVTQHLDLRASRLMGRLIEPGSRLVMLVRIHKDPTWPVNYGTGREVNRETIADAGSRLRIRWSSASYIDLPLSAAP